MFSIKKYRSFIRVIKIETIDNRLSNPLNKTKRLQKCVINVILKVLNLSIFTYDLSRNSYVIKENYENFEYKLLLSYISYYNIIYNYSIQENLKKINTLIYRVICNVSQSKKQSNNQCIHELHCSFTITVLSSQVIDSFVEKCLVLTKKFEQNMKNIS